MGPQLWTKELAPRFVYSEAFARITAIRAAVAQEIQSLPTCAHKFNFILLHWKMKAPGSTVVIRRLHSLPPGRGCAPTMSVTAMLR
jgi:hypothetical protein